MMNNGNRTNASGFSLLEICVAMAVYSVGLAGFSMLLMLAMQTSVNAENRTWAAMHTASVADLALMNADAGEHRVFPFGENVENFHALIGKQLPGGKATVCADSTLNDGDASSPACDGAGGQVMKVFWSTPGGPDEARTPGRMSSHLPK